MGIHISLSRFKHPKKTLAHFIAVKQDLATNIMFTM